MDRDITTVVKGLTTHLRGFTLEIGGGYNEIVQGKPHHAFGPLKLPKMDFPKFEGKDPRGWVNKCEKFFVLNPYMDSKTKVIFATLHMEGDADIWF